MVIIRAFHVCVMCRSVSGPPKLRPARGGGGGTQNVTTAMVIITFFSYNNENARVYFRRRRRLRPRRGPRRRRAPGSVITRVVRVLCVCGGVYTRATMASRPGNIILFVFNNT